MATQREVLLPDIGDFEEVEVVEVMVSPGDRVEVEDSLIVLESDKASMEIPSPYAGVMVELKVSVGDHVSQGALIAVIDVTGEDAEKAEPAAAEPREPAAPVDAAAGAPAASELPRESARQEPRESAEPESMAEVAPAAADRAVEEEDEDEGAEVLVAAGAAAERPDPHASPSVRRLARELGVDLSLVPGSGRKGRIVKRDVEGYVKGMLAKGTAAGVPIAGVSVAAPLKFDFAKFGPTELQPLNRVRKLSAANLHRSWVTVPHVTQFDEADITELDAFRREQKPDAERRGIRLTFLPFVVKACARALIEFPHFNASLDHTGESLILKRYYHLGVAVDTENGLVVPVVRDAERKGLYEIAEELMELSERARGRKLRPADLQGGTFSISSLGGLGGTLFTPIVNHPEVAILGVSRMEWKPVFRDGEFVPRLMLPLSLSYDHRVIDGADAARFTTRLAELLGDLRRLIL